MCILIGKDSTEKLYEYIKSIKFERWATTKEFKDILEELKIRKR